MTNEEPTPEQIRQPMPYRGALRAIHGQEPMAPAEFAALSPLGKAISDAADALVVEVFGNAQQRGVLHQHMQQNRTGR